MRLGFLKSPPVLIAAPVIAVVCLLQISRWETLQRIEWDTYDWRVRLARAYPSGAQIATNLGFVEINDQSIEAVDSGALGYQFGLYWPRQVYGRALEELTRQGAKAVAFDVMFIEERPDQPDYTNGATIVHSDDFFADQLERAGNVILATDKGELPARKFFKKAMRVGNISTDLDADGVLRRERPYVDLKRWHPKITAFDPQYHFKYDKTIFGPTNVTFYGTDRDGSQVTVSYHMDTNGYIDQPEGTYYKPFLPYRAWGLGVCLAAQELGVDLDDAEVQTNLHRIVLHGSHGLTRIIPLDKDGMFYIDWSIPFNDPQLARQDFDRLLAAPLVRATNGVVGNYWKGKLAVIGSTATGNDLTDRGVTPLESETYLVSKHWNVANSIITGRFITPTPLYLDLALIVAMGALFCWITLATTRPQVSTVIVVGVSLVYVAISAAFFVAWRIWVPIILPLGCSGFVTHLITTSYRVRMEQNERKRVKATFQRLVSPDIVNELLDAKSISLSSRRELTIYFADVRGFTELSDLTQQRAEAYVAEHKLTDAEQEAFYDEQARDVLNTVSLYLGTITNAIKSHRGTLDKYIGDCVMAFWGAPVPNPEHALNAVRAAIDSQRALHALNRQREAQNARREEENAARIRVGLAPHYPLPILSMGSGINSGVAIAGLMGSEKHLSNYTVFGREVNLASRLEGVSGHGRIIIGSGTFIALQSLDPVLAATCKELSPQKVKGFREPVRIYEVPWETDSATGATAFIEKTTQFIPKSAVMH